MQRCRSRMLLAIATVSAIALLLPSTAASAAPGAGNSHKATTSSPAGRATDSRGAPTADPRGDVRPRLRWTTCPDMPDQQCARFVVPRNWSNPTLGTFDLAVRRLPATGPHVIGTMFTNPGGPGESGTEILSAFTNDAALRSRFNIVAWDPRGVPTTTPGLRECPEPAGFPTGLLTGPFTWNQIAASRLANEATSGKQCFALNRGLAAYLGTNDVVRDLDALRAAVGDKLLTYVGYSYGTSIGRTYALTYPSRVRAMILDGATAPQAVMGTYLVNQGIGGATAWPMILASLPKGIPGVYRRVSARLQTQTVVVQGVRVSRWELWSLTINAGRAKMTLDTLPATICGLAKGMNMNEPACRNRTASRAALRLSIDRARAVAMGSPALRLINCADMSGRPTTAQLTASLSRFASASGPEAASNVLNFASMCSGLPPAWNQIPRLRVTSPVALPSPPLIINSVGDVATPYVGALANHSALAGSRLITVRSTFHGVFGLTNSACVDRPALSYLITRALPPRDLTCPSP